MKMFLSRIASGLLVVGTVMICLNEIGAASVSDQVTTPQNSEQQAQDKLLIFDQENSSILLGLNDKFSEQPLDERCSSLNRTLRLIYSGKRPELVDASTLDVYKAAIEELENRTLEAGNYELVLATLKECAECSQHTQVACSTNTNNHQDLEQPPELIPDTTPMSDYDVAAQDSEQQAAQDKPPIFDQENSSILFKVNDESREKPLDERCSLLNGALRLIYNGTRPELVDASTLDVYTTAIEELENRTPEEGNHEPVLETLKECAENSQHTQATSSTNTNNQQDSEQPLKPDPDTSSMLAQLDQTQDQLVKQNLTNNEQLRQLESDLERERGLASHREQVIAELQAKLSGADVRLSMLAQLEQTQGQLVRQNSAYNELLGKLGSDLERERSFASYREHVIAGLQAKLSKADAKLLSGSQLLRGMEQDLLAQQRRGLQENVLIEELNEKNIYIEELKEKLHGAEQAYLALSDAISGVDGQGDGKLSGADDELPSTSQTLSKIEQNLFEEQRRSLEKDVLIEELKEKLGGAEQAYLALCDAISGDDSRGDELTVLSSENDVEPGAGSRENLARVELGSSSGATHAIEIEKHEQVLARVSSQSDANSSGYMKAQPQPHDLDVNSILAQLIEQRSSDRERFEQLENDLAREKKLALERERRMDELLNKVREEEFKGILARLKFESEDLKQDLTLSLSEIDQANNILADEKTRQRQRSDNIKSINKRMNEFQRVLKRQLKTVLNITDALTAKRDKKSSQYAPTKRSLAKLESAFEKIKQYPMTLSRSEEVELMRQRLEEFHWMSKKQLKMILDNVDSFEAEHEESSHQPEQLSQPVEPDSDNEEEGFFDQNLF